jgi:hypothetical protein
MTGSEKRFCHILIKCIGYVVLLGGVIVIMLTIGPKVCVSNLAESDGF